MDLIERVGIEEVVDGSIVTSSNAENNDNNAILDRSWILLELLQAQVIIDERGTLSIYLFQPSQSTLRLSSPLKYPTLIFDTNCSFLYI